MSATLTRPSDLVRKTSRSAGTPQGYSHSRQVRHWAHGAATMPELVCTDKGQTTGPEKGDNPLPPLPLPVPAPKQD